MHWVSIHFQVEKWECASGCIYDPWVGGRGGMYFASTFKIEKFPHRLTGITLGCSYQTKIYIVKHIYLFNHKCIIVFCVKIQILIIKYVSG